MATIAKTKPAPAKAAAAPQAPVKNFWPIVGKAWINGETNGKQMISVAIGRMDRIDGELVPAFDNITLNAGDRLVLRKATKREGMKDPDYDVCLPE